MNSRLFSLVALLTACLGGSGLARADSSTSSTTASSTYITLSLGSGQSPAVNRSACQSNLQIPVNYTLTSTGSLRIFLTQGSCSDTGGIDIRPDGTAGTSGSYTFGANLLSKTSPPCAANDDQTWYICAVLTSPSVFGSTSSTVDSVRLTIKYDTTPPPQPTLSVTDTGDGTIYLSWSGSSADHWIVRYTDEGQGTVPQASDPCVAVPDTGAPLDVGTDVVTDVGTDVGVDAGVDVAATDTGDPADTGDDVGATDDTGGLADAGDVGTSADTGTTPDTGTPAQPTEDTSKWKSFNVTNGSATSTTLTKLTNGQIYKIAIIAVDAAGNESVSSNVVKAYPRVIEDFYRAYHCAGGTEKGGFGCSTAASAALIPGLAFLTALGVGLYLRARRAGARS